MILFENGRFFVIEETYDIKPTDSIDLTKSNSREDEDRLLSIMKLKVEVKVKITRRQGGNLTRPNKLVWYKYSSGRPFNTNPGLLSRFESCGYFFDLTELITLKERIYSTQLSPTRD